MVSAHKLKIADATPKGYFLCDNGELIELTINLRFLTERHHGIREFAN